jgi:hypothetical protein
MIEMPNLGLLATFLMNLSSKSSNRNCGSGGKKSKGSSGSVYAINSSLVIQ